MCKMQNLVCQVKSFNITFIMISVLYRSTFNTELVEQTKSLMETICPIYSVVVHVITTPTTRVGSCGAEPWASPRDSSTLAGSLWSWRGGRAPWTCRGSGGRPTPAPAGTPESGSRTTPNCNVQYIYAYEEFRVIAWVGTRGYHPPPFWEDTPFVARTP